jgi:hypothetical protein
LSAHTNNGCNGATIGFAVRTVESGLTIFGSAVGTVGLLASAISGVAIALPCPRKCLEPAGAGTSPNSRLAELHFVSTSANEPWAKAMQANTRESLHMVNEVVEEMYRN